MPRYEVSGIPPSQAAVGLSAFLPHYVRLAASGAQAFKGGVVGQPGTARIPAPIDGNQITGHVDGPYDLSDLALMGGARSTNAPQAIWPNLYYDRMTQRGEGGRAAEGERYYPGAGMPVQIYDPTRPQDTTVIPVPAVDLRSVYQARSALLSGGVAANQGSRGAALRQAMAFVRWPTRRTGNGPGTGSP